jgi:Xaa-Pro aminopeptidase
LGLIFNSRTALFLFLYFKKPYIGFIIYINNQKMKNIYVLLTCVFFFNVVVFSQQDEGLPTDYLTKEFHTGRREALRKLMPDNSVTVIFSYPARVFSKDINFPYHQNPDLYYFSGYKEANAVLLIFKETQTTADNKTYKDLFFIQKKDPQQEQWTGKRMGVEKVKSQLGFDMVFNGSEFKNFPIDFSKFSKIFFDALPSDIADDVTDSADLYDLVKNFKQKAGIPDDWDNEINLTLEYIAQHDYKNLTPIKGYLQKKVTENDRYKNNALINEIINIKDSAGFVEATQKIKLQKLNSALYTRYTSALREIKTPEEMDLLRKSIEISSIAHLETMKAINPGMSELEIQGLQEYIHKKYGAEYVGYPSIVGAGVNGCTLHYEENAKTKIGNDMVLMDVGAEYHGYSADITRTVPSTGRYTVEQKEIYNLVYNAQEEVYKLCKDGTPFGALNKKATEVLADGLLKLGIIKDEKEVGKYYPHGCSHHLGLDVHDKSNYDSLKENMVITVEPGIYIPENSPCDKKWWGIAVRIEDDVRIGKDKCELLSYLAPRKAEDVEKAVAEKSALDNFILQKLPADKKAF